MRIAMCTETYIPYMNGVVTHIKLLKRALEAMGHEVLIVTVSNEKDMVVKDGVLHCPSFRVERVYGYRGTNPFSRERLAALQAFNPDVIHVHNEYTLGFFGVRAARKLQVPLVYSIHMDFNAYLAKIPGALSLFKRPLLAYLNYYLKRADVILSMSHKAQTYIDMTGSKKKMELLPNSVEVKRFASDPEETQKRLAMRRTLGLSDSTRAFVYVGRLSLEKNIEHLIDSFLYLDLPSEKARLFFVGDGPHTKALKAKVAAADASDRITFLGSVENEKIADTLFAMDYYLTASLSEMHSMSMLEAMAAGLFCLVLEEPVNAWQVKDDVTGWIWKNEDELKRQVAILLADDEKTREERRRRAKAWSLAHDEQHQVETLLAVYERAVNGYVASVATVETDLPSL